MDPDVATNEVAPNTNDRFIVKVGRDAELELAAAFYLGIAGDDDIA